jgi:butyryl-CoA dehydrogenase
MQIDTQERRMLREAAQRFAEREYSFEVRNRSAALPEGFDLAHWQRYAEMGWLALGLPEDCGGFGDIHDQLALAEALGSMLALEPWLANLGLAAPILAASERPEHRALLSALAEGRMQVALAAWEPGGRYDAFETRTIATSLPNGRIRIDGRKSLVLGGGTAHRLIVSARMSGAPRDPGGIALFLIDINATGVSRRNLPGYDGQPLSMVELSGVEIDASALVAAPDSGWPLLESAIDRATVLACAQAVGAMDLALARTREYLSTRKQFGRVLTSNQVIRHRLVDLYVAIEQSRAITESAAGRLDAARDARIRSVSQAKAFVSQAARRTGEDAVQLHGAIGMTDEYQVGHAYKRLAAFANLFGDAPWHLQRLAALGSA